MKEDYFENINDYITREEAKIIVREFTANQTKLETYYKIGKELSEAGKHYGEGIVKKYSVKLTSEFGKGFQYKELYKLWQFYNLCEKVAPVEQLLT